MTPCLAGLRQQIFGISLKETTFAQRCFHQGDARSQQRLEQIGEIFLFGYHTALRYDRSEVLAHQLNQVELELRGFAFEGAAMGLALQDALIPWRRNRLHNFLAGPGAAHVYMVHVGVGWVLARLHQRVKPFLQRLDPLLGWLTVDGYGFHEGYFHWQWAVAEQIVPNRLSGYACRVFDQGLGRSLWFIDGGDVARIPVTISQFPTARQADLWSGVGLACAYAGGVERAGIEALRQSAGIYLPCIAQGAVFAAKARQNAGNSSEYTEIACEVLCDCSANAAAKIADIALEQLPIGTEPAYEIWRRRIQAQFAIKQVQPYMNSCR
ncbi:MULTISPECIES: DUF1702 family protein [unclassified Tolypothrix]|uniref:DUF1702 family protein n=1 Tax=unclassified Tolypothrix TaxID=2649714 RepID=UPI0005EAA4EE|nr:MULTISPECIES: DUF1702 family protein [unclassified Tolypothrix]BAY91348.1 hypothetical protein NIES3275_33710 [Microchaete diplosiphon NIES-3275]EKF04529.1 hypothetical protein FDUTEX481_01798 [Tolypothrix sp. PCC 7601]MBE9080964.1 DUF1702 family protein [Tolypothrix sp. LEGE 11397]UYD25406.1 DUF1702 family protein [Tolypothrix sp. PCC 7712]UYD32350.1 DUF1702 family protein [Tolypothrix sp. PCC 7601]